MSQTNATVTGGLSPYALQYMVGNRTATQIPAQCRATINNAATQPQQVSITVSNVNELTVSCQFDVNAGDSFSAVEILDSAGQVIMGITLATPVTVQFAGQLLITISETLQSGTVTFTGITGASGTLAVSITQLPDMIPDSATATVGGAQVSLQVTAVSNATQYTPGANSHRIRVATSNFGTTGALTSFILQRGTNPSYSVTNITNVNVPSPDTSMVVDITYTTSGTATVTVQ